MAQVIGQSGNEDDPIVISNECSLVVSFQRTDYDL